jgi:hypothetical protein
METALWLGVDSSHLCWPDCWGAWLWNWSVLTAGCRWNVPTCIYLCLTPSHYNQDGQDVSCLYFVLCFAQRLYLRHGCQKRMAGPTRSCLIMLWPSIGCFWSLVCSISCVIRSPGRVPPSFCGLHFTRVVDIDELFCDGNWCRFKNFKTACDVTRYLIM